MKEAKVTIKIPRKLYDNLAEVTKNSGFNSVTDFIVYCLRDIAYATKAKEDQKLSSKDIENVKERLKKLGYLS
ncbi:MAG: CopG family transcriptional regulator [Patescibacteria group bacterium]|jgi:Arc/MetJ-type ribon-helix-helix transcriptional regulator